MIPHNGILLNKSEFSITYLGDPLTFSGAIHPSVAPLASCTIAIRPTVGMSNGAAITLPPSASIPAMR